MDERIVLQDVTRILKEELTDSLVGIYLHGSMAMGCFHPNQSDIDILVVCRDKRSADLYRRIAQKLMHMEDEMHMTKGFELSIVLESTTANLAYPTPFEFHYSAITGKSIERMSTISAEGSMIRILSHTSRSSMTGELSCMGHLLRSSSIL
ncbi:nucleotidyltransferase domain-containing protein [Paenibacillus sp. 7516]|uniref:nucleotidyltransferase domain-containing protein n=1 Tax=Paenibacillus sp. 7516 TaxID=2022549 RepID=UPI002016195C|nr:nucleotidyltransferase domain-containing protein [Paenibacillus sp. 7516]